MDNFNSPAEVNQESLDLGFIFRQYILKYWYLFIVFPIIGAGIAAIYLRYQVPVYTVRSTILIKEESDANTVSEDLLLQQLGVLSNANVRVDNEIQILKSMVLLQDVVTRLGLDVDYYWEGRVRNTELYKRSPILVDTFSLMPFAYNKFFRIKAISNNTFQFYLDDNNENVEEYRFGEQFTNQYGTFRFSFYPTPNSIGRTLLLKISPVQQKAQILASRLTIRAIGQGGMIELSLTDQIPGKAVDIINTLINIYDAAAIDDKNKVGSKTVKFIEERLKFLSQDLARVEEEVEDYKTDNLITIDVFSDVQNTLFKLGEVEKTIQTVELELSIIIEIENFLKQIENQFSLIPANFEMGLSSINSQINQLNEQILFRDRLKQNATPDNPQLIALEQELLSQRSNLIQSIRLKRNDLEQQLKTLKGQQEGLQNQIRSVPTKEREFQEIKRQQTIKETLYLFLLQKREETEMALAVATPNSRIINPPRGGLPKSVSSITAFTVAIISGFIAAALIVFVLNVMNDRIQSEQEIKQRLSVPIIGRIGQSKTLENIVVKMGSRTSVSEMFRLLRTNLQFFNSSTEKASTFLVTSSFSGEGKTFVAVNLAMSIALSKKKVVVVGLDLRKPKIAEYLGIPKEHINKGVSTYLIGQATIEEIIYDSETSEVLDVIPSGPIPPNPSELLMSDELKQLMEELKNRYDYIIIDTPPVGLVTDALLLNNYVNSALYIVRYGQTKRGMLQIAAEIRQQNKLKNLSVVFNGIKARSAYGAGYGYGYGYGYTYYQEV